MHHVSIIPVDSADREVFEVYRDSDKKLVGYIERERPTQFYENPPYRSYTLCQLPGKLFIGEFYGDGSLEKAIRAFYG